MNSGNPLDSTHPSGTSETVHDSVSLNSGGNFLRELGTIVFEPLSSKATHQQRMDYEKQFAARCEAALKLKSNILTFDFSQVQLLPSECIASIFQVVKKLAEHSKELQILAGPLLFKKLSVLHIGSLPHITLKNIEE